MRLSFTNPWWVVVGAVGGLIVCNGPVLGFTFGVFLKPIMADMGWQRGTASFALSFGGICSALTVPVLGRMMDRWSIRRVALPGLVIYAITMCLLGLSPKSLVIFTLLFALAEAASAVQTPIGYAKAISAWFDRRRGLALGIAMSGVGLGGFIMPQLAQMLIERVGWRGAYPILGLLTLAIAFPLVALWIREPRPGEGERRPQFEAAGLLGSRDADRRKESVYREGRVGRIQLEQDFAAHAVDLRIEPALSCAIEAVKRFLERGQSGFQLAILRFRPGQRRLDERLESPDSIRIEQGGGSPHIQKGDGRGPGL